MMKRAVTPSRPSPTIVSRQTIFSSREALHGLLCELLLGLAEGVIDVVAGMGGRAAHGLRVGRDGACLRLDHALVAQGDALELIEGATLGEALFLLGVVVDLDGGLLEGVHVLLLLV